MLAMALPLQSDGVLVMEVITKSVMHFVNHKRLLDLASRYSAFLGVLLDVQVAAVLRHLLVR